MRPLLERNFAAWSATVERWLEGAAGRLSPGTDLGALSRFVLTVMEGAVMQSRASGSLAPFDASVACLRRHFDLLEERAPGRRR
jgi:hypothetical protein